MSEKRSRETADAAEALWKLLGSPEWKLYEIAEVIQAAEERGRRRGVGERDKLLREAVDVLRLWPSTEEFGRDHARELCIRIAAVVYPAPRDSAPARYCSAEHPSQPLRCGRFVEHDGPHTAYDPDYSFENRTAVHWEDRK